MFWKKENYFRHSKELKDLHPLLKELRNKEKQLNTLVDDNAGNPAYKKSIIITNTCAQIDEIIQQFNSQPRPLDRSVEIHNILVLITHLKNVIIVCLEKHRDILNTPRPTLSHTISQNRVPTTLSSSVILGIGTSSFLFATLPIVGVLALETVSNWMGLDSPVTASLSILERLLNKLELINNSLNFVVDEYSTNNKPRVPALYCPITLQRMQRPVLCLLDNRMYDKDAIEKWLTVHRTSPFTRKPLLPEQAIDSVLIENISLKEAIEELEHSQYRLNNTPSAPPMESGDEFKKACL